MKRQFRGDKLYKIIKFTVIIATISSWLIFIYSVNWGGVNASKLSWQQYQICQKTFGKDWKFYKKAYDECVQVAVNIGKSHDRIISNALKIGMFLPIVFFGGGVLINYLFPKKDKK